MEPTGVAERTKLRAALLGSYRAAPAPAAVHTFCGDDSLDPAKAEATGSCPSRGDLPAGRTNPIDRGIKFRLT